MRKTFRGRARPFRACFLLALAVSAALSLSVVFYSCLPFYGEDDDSGKSPVNSSKGGESSQISETQGESSLEIPSRPSQPAQSGSQNQSQSQGENNNSKENSSETSEEENLSLGELFAPYFDIILTGEYMRKTVETRAEGGEAVPYTITAYHTKGALYAEIEESYGFKSKYIIKDGSAVALDDFTKTALVLPYTNDIFSEKTLWTGKITLTDYGEIELFDKTYDYESYKDETGFEFSVFFSGGALKRYRSYDEKLKDTIVIGLTISEDITSGVFTVPEGYTIIPSGD
ncbi:MAG: hypothetical protein WCR95_04240 [Eubacteriales bacterium]